MEIIIAAVEEINKKDQKSTCNGDCRGDNGACKDNECLGDGQETDDCQMGS